MQKKNIKTIITWRNWLIKKLLTKETSKEDILNFIAKEEKEIISIEDNQIFEDNNEKNLIKNILNLNEKSVEDVMVTRAEIISIEKKKTIKEILSVIKNESHSRMPVYDQNLDNVLGFLHIKDVIKNINNKNFIINDILRDVLYVAPKSPILDLLKRMRSSRIHMGLVVDEFGGVDGLVTIEDLVEEIVGEIEDEHDAEDDEVKIKRINDRTIIVDAAYKIIELEDLFQLKIKEAKEEEIDTVGGLVSYVASKVPNTNEVFVFNNQLKFKILEADERKVITLEIKKIT
ncbi:MAG: CBS domain-containing protein [Pelagibacteraceae bacterium]|jgi:CBS domain containing-hemolysin-like protein|nr:CBS domain-containing protein [Pelagibacteraceae bacterium]HJO13884.1 CBS domain-containing protein [Alphaproteobacteria bacterium]MBO6466017.1 CBS domain-containing protein [Pelagibacteraceae bacterium]MBO6468178.1 CBS domain-containing protein [Pelagibacteraceae bacterium]MBO6469940.1 CBS domain-containing protein [Pelagibacteraceae bacterium]|tara:strand:- start:328 stop:1191 length:864 start_codon:yes stop_codon:yes gene_type:complete